MTGISSAGVMDYYAAVGANIVPGTTPVFTFGNNPDIDAGPEDIWGGDGLYPWLTGATALEMVSDSAADAAAGTGARTVTINALDINFAEVTLTVTLNGVTPVALASNVYRINAVTVATAGSGGVNTGTLTLRNTGAGTTRATVPAGVGRSRGSYYTVPAGKTLMLNYLFYCINAPSSVRDATLAVYTRNTGTANSSFMLASEASVDGNPFQRLIIPPAPLFEKTDIIIRCTYVSATNTNITAAWGGVLRTN